MRQDQKGVLVGIYEIDHEHWAMDGAPWDYGEELFQEQLDRIENELTLGFQRYPAMGGHQVVMMLLILVQYLVELVCFADQEDSSIPIQWLYWTIFYNLLFPKYILLIPIIDILSHFSSVSTPAYRSGWDNIFGNKNNSKSIVTKSESKTPEEFVLNDNEIDKKLRQALYEAFSSYVY